MRTQMISVSKENEWVYDRIKRESGNLSDFLFSCAWRHFAKIDAEIAKANKELSREENPPALFDSLEPIESEGEKLVMKETNKRLDSIGIMEKRIKKLKDQITEEVKLDKPEKRIAELQTELTQTEDRLADLVLGNPSP